MFGVLRAQSRSAAGAIMYVTVGVLLMIWSTLWYFYFLRPDPNPPAWQMFACMGTIFSGLAIGLIGLLFGLIGRGAKGADNTVGVAATTPMVTNVQTPGVVGATAPIGTVLPASIPTQGIVVTPATTATLRQ